MFAEQKFTKYSRTYHLPYSKGVQSDDKVLKSTAIFEGMEVVLPEKMDGENTSLYRHGMHARSLDSAHNFTRDWVKRLQSLIAHEIPDGWRFCGENVNYLHSIEYNELESYFYLFSIWTDKNECLSWDDMLEWAHILDLATPQVFYRGVYDEKAIVELSESLDTNVVEGYVLRNVESFHYDDFGRNVGKFVRKGHVQTGDHWLKNTRPNKLAESSLKPGVMFL